MMKRNRLTILLALALAVVMAFTSCSFFDSSENEDKESTVLPPVVNTDVKVNYRDAVSAWTEYLSFVAPETTPVYTTNKLSIHGNVANGVVPTISGEYIYTRETVDNTVVVDDGNSSSEKKVSTTTTEKWYNATDGSLIQKFVSVTPEIKYVLGLPTIDESLRISDLVSYSIDRGSKFVKVTKYEYVIKEVNEGEDPLDRNVFSNYTKQATSISYYFNDGSLFLEDLVDVIAPREVENSTAYNAGYYLVDCKEKDATYLILGNKVIREFGYKQEYNLPIYDENSSALNGGYAYFEVKDNKYVITEEAPVVVPMGDLALYLVPGMTIRITDENDKSVAYYSTECYGIAGYAVLDNGNVYICEYHLLSKDAAEYDILSGEDKLNVTHKLISAKNGSISELDMSFTAQKLFNNNTKKINSFINYMTLEMTNSGECLLDSAQVDAGYVIAEIQKYQGGNLDAKTSYVVLDANLEIVKELPAIIQNQFSYPAFLDADNMVVCTRAVGNKTTYYSIDISSGEVTLAPSLSMLKDVQLLNNGYYYDYKIYDKNWNIIHDFAKDENFNIYRADFRVINKTLYFYTFTENDTDEVQNISRANITYYGYDKDANYTYNTETVLSNASFTNYEGIIRADSSDGDYYYYNLNADRIISIADDSTRLWSEVLSKNVRYSIEKSVESIRELEDGYLVVVRCYGELDESYYDVTGLELPEYFYTYEYYVIK